MGLGNKLLQRSDFRQMTFTLVEPGNFDSR